MVDDAVPPPVRVELLGPLGLVVDGSAVDVRGPKRRAVLAILAFAAGRTVPVGHLVDALWPAEAPSSGRSALQAHISRIRRHLGLASERLQAVADGYRLDLSAHELDVVEARNLLAEARGRMGDDPAGALDLLRKSHGLWRGPLLADLTDITDIATSVEECRQLHRDVTDTLIHCAIDAGQSAGVVGLATSWRSVDPLREPSVLLAMRVLAATGQSSEALAIGRRFRTQLADEMGLDPSPALAELERGIAGGGAGPPAGRSGSPRVPRSRLIGRDRQVAELELLLGRERLVTLVGPGGVGKTSVAMEIAANGSEVTVLLPAPLSDPAAIPHALAEALNVNVIRGDVVNACAAVIGDREQLVIVDNCEHLLDAARDVIVTLLDACPRLTIFATSRESLGLAEEFVSRLTPLPLPSGSSGGLAVPSVELFVDRGRRVRPDFEPTASQLETVSEIVSRLDGMPLAIELAAGRLSTFTLTDLRDRLDRSLDLLGGGRRTGDVRHRTLRSTIEWSYDLLEPDEQLMFRRLTVFADGIDLAAAEQLSQNLGLHADPGAILARLVDASVVNVDFTGGTARYRILETIRAFGIDRLTAENEKAAAEDLLLDWAIECSRDIGAGLMTDREPEADAALRRELGNLRVAWRLARRRGSMDAAVWIVNALFDAISYRDLIELRGWAQELADDPGLLAHPGAPIAFGVAAEATYHGGDHQRAVELSQIGLGCATNPSQTWTCLAALAVTALARGDHPQVIEYCLAAEKVTPRPAEPLGVAALAATYSGDIEQAQIFNTRGRAGANFPSMVAWNEYVTGEIENFAGNGLTAEEHYLRAIDLARSTGATFLIGISTVGLLTVRSRSGRIREALGGYLEVVDYFARTGNWTHLWAALRNLADLLDDLGDRRIAAMLHAAADQAPDAPAHDRSPTPGVVVPGRTTLLDVARTAIEQQLR